MARWSFIWTFIVHNNVAIAYEYGGDRESNRLYDWT